MKNLDTIDIQFIPNGNSECAVLVLNGTTVSGHFDVVRFVASGGLRYVEFEIMTCSCGNAGCAGIFYGTRVKRRRNTVEWRDIDCGLPKKFYAFDLVAYDTLVLDTIDRLVEIVKAQEGRPISESEDDYEYYGQICFNSVGGDRGLNSGLEYSRDYLLKYCSK
jgi:hypothetical protein